MEEDKAFRRLVELAGENSIEMKTVGQLLVGYREKVNELRSQLNRKSLTQEELADEVGVSEISIGNWERDVNRPGAKHLKNLTKL